MEDFRKEKKLDTPSAQDYRQERRELLRKMGKKMSKYGKLRIPALILMSIFLLIHILLSHFMAFFKRWEPVLLRTMVTFMIIMGLWSCRFQIMAMIGPVYSSYLNESGDAQASESADLMEMISYYNGASSYNWGDSNTVTIIRDANFTDDVNLEGLKFYAGGDTKSADVSVHRLSSATYTLNSDFDLYKPLYVPEGTTAVLDLNGHTINCEYINNVYSGYSNVLCFGILVQGELTIKDSSGNNSGQIYSCNNQDNPVDGQVYLGTICVGGSSSNALGTLNLEGGTICANNNKYGGAIANFGTVNMTGGYIWTNKALDGAGIYNGQVGTCNITGGEFYDNTASGGGVISNYGSLNISGGSLRSNHGEEVVLNGSSGICIMSGGTIDYDKTTSNTDMTSAIRNEGGQLTLSGGTISNQYAWSGGGLFIVAGDGMKVDISGVNFTGNQAYEGSAIYLYSSYRADAISYEVYLHDIDIEGNTGISQTSGSAVYVSSKAVLTIGKNTKILNNTCQGSANLLLAEAIDGNVGKIAFKNDISGSKMGVGIVELAGKENITGQSFDQRSAGTGTFTTGYSAAVGTSTDPSTYFSMDTMNYGTNSEYSIYSTSDKKELQINVQTHEHNWVYTLSDDGSKILAYCNSEILPCTYYGTEDSHSVTATAYIQTDDILYDGTPYADVEVNNGITDVTGEEALVTYIGRNGTTYASTTTPPTEVGQYTAILTIGGQSLESDFTIGDSRAQLTTEPVALDLTYNGSEQVLITAGSSDQGQLYYQQTDGSWDTALPSAVDAGTYEIPYYIKATSGTGYYDRGSESSPCGTVTCTIQPKALTESMVSMNFTTATYTGKLMRPDCQVEDYVNEVNLINENDYRLNTGDPHSKVGQYAVQVVAREDGNYTGTLTLTWNIEAIGPAQLTEKPQALDLTYDGSSMDLISEGQAEHGTIYYKVEGDQVSTDLASTEESLPDGWSKDLPQGLNAGTYTVSYYVAAEEGYTSLGSSEEPYRQISVSINKKKLTEDMVSLEYTYKVYSGETMSPQVTVSDTIDGRNLITNGDYTLTGTEAQKDKGSYQILVTATDEGNYTGCVTMQWRITGDLPQRVISAVTDESLYGIYQVLAVILLALGIIFVDRKLFR